MLNTAMLIVLNALLIKYFWFRFRQAGFFVFKLGKHSLAPYKAGVWMRESLSVKKSTTEASNDVSQSSLEVTESNAAGEFLVEPFIWSHQMHLDSNIQCTVRFYKNHVERTLTVPTELIHQRGIKQNSEGEKWKCHKAVWRLNLHPIQGEYDRQDLPAMERLTVNDLKEIMFPQQVKQAA